MDKNYYSPYKTGGSNLANGIAYQDLVSLLYMCKHIESKSFKEITFETDDDFTILFDTHEMYVQVKNTTLTTPQIRKILESKSVNSDNKYVKHVIIASSYDQKFKSLLKSYQYFININETHRSEQEKYDIKEEFNELLRKNGLDPAIFHGTEFEEIPDAQIKEVVGFHMYRWLAAQNLEIEIEDLFNKLITNISLHLRPNRGFLNKNEIGELVLSCPRKKSIRHEMPRSIIYFDYSKESILGALNKDIAEKTHFSDKLTLIKLYIETEQWSNAQKLACEINKYEDSFMYYYLWLLFQSGKMNKLIKQCNQLIKQLDCLYYSYYFKGLVFIERKDYSRAIDSLTNAFLNESTFEVNLTLAKLHNMVGNHGESLGYYRFCLIKQPLNKEVLVGISPLVSKNEAIAYLDQAIEMDPTFYKAYLEKGKILRYYGLNEESYDYFQKYLDHNDVSDKDSKEVLREMSLCLLSMGNEKAFNYLNSWLSDLLFNENNGKIKIDKNIVILDGSLKNMQLILCTKSGEDYIIRTSIREYLLIKGENSQIAIGCTVDSFLEMSKKIFSEHNLYAENGYEYVPSIIKLYRSKNEFDKVIKSMSLQDNTYLNKDYYFTDEQDKGRWHFKEYISKDKATNVLIEELQNAIHVQVGVGNSVITGWFKKGGDNYFKFCSKVEKPPDFEKAVLILECGESKQKVHIIFDVYSIKIMKSASYPREAYIKDVILPV
ncbi:dsDNA nuclease domain-containing protein [Cytobacillus purgationiresistens]|uniref:Tetratricopeptide (TPR) repeat protein n=1 Tax=Cytobacillus purgationiresistens TaxID=863449 RepID=A0ABU0ARA3_9BACI|nr:dsDNA nuclease domain-containing protein [Cytobacillus purgationiresistens]MDQ0273804.1 tetratricopeptide (TPR) repeat protein [Cytobacillus purgationiresistens]